MTALAELARDERTARMVLSMIAEPHDPVTGQVLGRVGAEETLRLIDSHGATPWLSRVDAQVWRDRLSVRAARTDELACCAPGLVEARN